MVETNKRDHPRAPIELKVEYKKMNTFFSDYTKNISKGGTFIKTERPLSVGTKFLFKLFLPKRTEPFVLNGEVVWVNGHDVVQNPDVSDKGMGIRFVFASQEEQKTFETQVEQLMSESLGSHLYKKLLKRS